MMERTCFIFRLRYIMNVSQDELGESANLEKNHVNQVTKYIESGD